MLSKSDPGFNEAASTVYQLSQDEQIREQCEAREDYYRRMGSIRKQFQETRRELEQAITERDEVTRERDRVTQERDKVTQERDNAIFEADRLRKLLEKHGIDTD